MKADVIQQVDYPRFNLLLAALVFAYVGAFFLQLGLRLEILGAIRFEFLVAGLLLAWSLIYRDKVDYPPTGIAGPLAFLILCMVIQVPLSADMAHSWMTFVDRVLKFAAMAWIIARFINSPRMLIVFLAAFLLSCFKMGQEGLLGNLTGGLVWQNQGVMRLHGSTPMYRHPNSFAGMAMGTLPFIYYLYPVVNKYVKAFLLIMLAFAINIIVFSASRTAYVAFVGMLGYVFWVSEHKKKIGLGIIAVVIAAFVYMPEQYKERFASIYTGEEAEGDSSGARLQILEDALHIWIEHPFGVGVAAFPIVRQEYFGRDADTHNLYLEVATNLGIQGLIAFLILIGAMIRSLRKTGQSLRRQLEATERISSGGSAELRRHQGNLRVYIAICNAVVAYIVVRLLLGMFGMDLYEIYWWIGVGFVVAMAKLSHVAGMRTRQYLEMCCASPKET